MSSGPTDLKVLFNLDEGWIRYLQKFPLLPKPKLAEHKLYFKELVSGSCIAGFCYCLDFTQIQQIAIKIPCLVHF
jgi:hypothetical protein